MMQRSVGLRENSRRSRGKIAFSGRNFAGTESERIRRSVELPGTPAEGLFSLSPTPSESLSGSLPVTSASVSLIPHAKFRVPPTQNHYSQKNTRSRGMASRIFFIYAQIFKPCLQKTRSLYIPSWSGSPHEFLP